MATPPEHLVELIGVSGRLLAHLKDLINAVNQDNNIPKHLKEAELPHLKSEAYDLSERIEELNEILREATEGLRPRTDARSSNLLKRPQTSELPDVAHEQNKRSRTAIVSRDPMASSSKQKNPIVFAQSNRGDTPASVPRAQAIQQEEPSTIQSHQPTLHRQPTPGLVDTASKNLTDRFFERSDVPRLPHGPSNLSAGYQNIIDREANLLKQKHPQPPSLTLRPSPSVQNRQPALPDIRLSMVDSDIGDWMHSSLVGCIIFNKKTRTYYKICCHHCGFNTSMKDKRLQFVYGIPGMIGHWSAARQCRGRSFDVLDLFAANTTELLTEGQALEFVLHPELIQMNRGDKSLPDAHEIMKDEWARRHAGGGPGPGDDDHEQSRGSLGDHTD